MIAGLIGVAFLLLLVALAAGFTDVFGPYFSDGGEVIGPPTLAPSVTGTAKEKGDITIVGAQTNQLAALSFPIANLKAILITISGNATATVVLKTNSTGSPADTLTFPIGGGELLWTNRAPSALKPLTAAVTATYWTHTGTETVTVRVRALYDA